MSYTIDCPVYTIYLPDPTSIGEVLIKDSEGSSDIIFQSLQVTPSQSSQYFVSETGYAYNSVSVDPIPFVEVPNDAGGTTVYIGTSSAQ